MRRLYVLTTVMLMLGIGTGAEAYSDYPTYIQEYRRAYQSQANREHHKILYGYHPYHFSNAARSRHSYSAFEKGHYRYGTQDKPWPFPKHKFRLQKDFKDSTRVLSSGATTRQQRKLNHFIEMRMKAAKSKKVQPQVNDSQALDEIIQQHKWEYQSKELRDAIRRDPDEVRADPTDYQLLFQNN